MEHGGRSSKAGLTIVEISVSSHEKMKTNWYQTIVAYFYKLEIKDMKKPKWI